MKYHVMYGLCGSTSLDFDNQYSSKVEGKSLGQIVQSLIKLTQG